jgi:hypothetical protein
VSLDDEECGSCYALSDESESGSKEEEEGSATGIGALLKLIEAESSDLSESDGEEMLGMDDSIDENFVAWKIVSGLRLTLKQKNLSFSWLSSKLAIYAYCCRSSTAS